MAAESRKCRRCQKVLPQIQTGEDNIHPFCKRLEDLETKASQPAPETEFDRALRRYPYPNGPEAG